MAAGGVYSELYRLQVATLPRVFVPIRNEAAGLRCD
jgi:hypothetical protein